MELQKSITKRRVGVSLTYLSLLVLVYIFQFENPAQWTFLLKVAGIIILLILFVSFYFTYVKTRLWQFIHKPLNKLDEREIELTSKSLRYAYAIFTVLTLLILLGLVFSPTQVHIVSVASLILFAHLLPASIIAWTERQV